ncbi:hypothetical protein P7H90_00910 [Lactococcus lactis]|uniref:hypothetical protein n=1 Tax=Lactococcus lactis TaxID=1358 RepID=UPI00288E5DE7|nr:hypothetical protein [Lactococcus lactis]MDT2917846.1 hypothetical protein [Lactococcus lactis]
MKTIQTKVFVASATTLLLATTVAGATLQAYQVTNSSLPKVSQSISADSVIKNAHALVVNDNGRPVVQSLDSDVSTSATDEGKAYEDILNSDDTTATTQTVKGAEVTTVINDDDNTVGAFSVKNTDDGTSVSVVNDGTSITIAKTTVDSTGQAQTEEQTVPIDNTTGVAQALAWTSWGYTNVAIGTHAFAAAVNAIVGAAAGAAIAAVLPGAVAAAFGISMTAARFIIGGASGFSLNYVSSYFDVGAKLASSLDKNKNGWIGIYYRHNPSTGAAQWKTQ